jgi:hypothetical protein
MGAAESDQTSDWAVIGGYAPAADQAWDALVERSVNGTLLHTRRFLSYHGNRFADRSVLITSPRGRLVGVLPAAQDPADAQVVTSHPGLTYGGLVHDGSLYGAAMVRLFEAIAGYYRGLGFTRMRYRAVPYIYQRAPAADDLYALFRMGAVRTGCDLAPVIDLACRGPVRPLRRRSRRRAEAAGARLDAQWPDIARFWPILQANLARRHGATPTHSLAEIEQLRAMFPGDIDLVTAKIDGDVVAGCVFFAAGPTMHMQYAATTDLGREVSATDLVLEHGIAMAAARGCRYFSFGRSTLGGGSLLDDQQYWFKVSFGAGGVIYEHYELAV